MTMNRRKFLASTSVAAIGALALPLSGNPAQAEMLLKNGSVVTFYEAGTTRVHAFTGHGTFEVDPVLVDGRWRYFSNRRTIVVGGAGGGTRTSGQGGGGGIH